MKSLLLLLAFVSCKNSTADKLKSRVEEIQVESFKKQALNLDKMKIENFRYHPCSAKDFFMWETAAGNLPGNDRRWQTADTMQKFFYVKYHLTATTDKINIDREEALYLLQTDLSQIKKAYFEK